MEYFYGRKPQTFFPFSYDVPFSEVKIYKIGGEFTAGIPYNRYEGVLCLQLLQCLSLLFLLGWRGKMAAHSLSRLSQVSEPYPRFSLQYYGSSRVYKYPHVLVLNLARFVTMVAVECINIHACACPQSSTLCHLQAVISSTVCSA